jgi:hypothetical protein
VSSSPVHGEVYSIQHYVIKFVSDLQHTMYLWFSPDTSVSSTNKTDRHNITEILLKVASNTKNQTKPIKVMYSRWSNILDTRMLTKKIQSIWKFLHLVTKCNTYTGCDWGGIFGLDLDPLSSGIPAASVVSTLLKTKFIINYFVIIATCTKYFLNSLSDVS